MTTFLEAVKNDFTSVWHVVETAAETGLTDAEKALESAATTVWTDFKPVVLAVEPVAYADLKTVILGLLTAFQKGTDAATIETALLNVLEAGGTSLFGIAKGLQSNLLQLIIGLVRAA